MDEELACKIRVSRGQRKRNESVILTLERTELALFLDLVLLVVDCTQETPISKPHQSLHNQLTRVKSAPLYSSTEIQLTPAFVFPKKTITTTMPIHPITGRRNNWAHAHRVTEEENGRAAKARAGVRLARAKAERWRNIVLV